MPRRIEPSSAAAALARRMTDLEARMPESRIELGLDRVRLVLDRLAPDLSARRIVTVAGTNGKGSTVAFIDAGLRAAGHRTLAYTSPHLLDVRERFRIDGELAPAADLVTALDAVEAARGSTSLTYFEHLTLAAFVLAAAAGVDVLVLEVGLGGRLDAVNVVDPDLAVVTSIGLDHQAWLGPTRARIATEKIGIARAGRPVIVAETDPPKGMLEQLESLGADVLAWGGAFDARWSRGRLSVRLGSRRIRDLRPGLAGRHQRTNAAAAVLVLDRLGLGEASIRRGIETACAPGRFERIAEHPSIFVDVAHNAEAARALRRTLENRPGRKFAVFAALVDKDVEAIGRALAPVIDGWYIAQLDGPRAVPAERLAERLRRAGVSGPPDTLKSTGGPVAAAIEKARAECRENDEIVVFGSFLTAAAACAANAGGATGPV